jgi:hypothetical protein
VVRSGPDATQTTTRADGGSHNVEAWQAHATANNMPKMTCEQTNPFNIRRTQPTYVIEAQAGAAIASVIALVAHSKNVSWYGTQQRCILQYPHQHVSTTALDFIVVCMTGRSVGPKAAKP